MPEGLTKIGYEELFNRIVNMSVEAPTGMTSDMLNVWLSGYMQSKDDILTLINKLKDQYGR